MEDKHYTWFNTGNTEYDPSFKWWFALMWQNGYIQIFIIALVFLIGMLYSLEIDQLWFCIIPVAILTVITILGFIKFPHELRDQYKK